MHRSIYGHSFAGLVARIFLSVLAFKFLNKKKTSARREAEDADPSASGSTTAPTESESGGSSSSPTETSDGPSTRKRYEVFLSFRGLDTRDNFTDHLHNGLCNAGIRTFRDDEELRQGEKIGPDLLAAINNSQILIPILSVNYGDSKWCLEELVRIMECKKNNTGQVVLPIFYKVAPADVRYQKGRFGEAFNKRESSERRRGSDSTILEKWKKALREVSDLKVWEANGSEVELINFVVNRVLLELRKKFKLVTPEYLIGIDSHVKKVMEFVTNNSRAALFVGIQGMGGIGKTTLAKTIYNKLSLKLECHSFIPVIRGSSKDDHLKHLQEQLISDTLIKGYKVSNVDDGISFISSHIKGKDVLILLDDVDHDDEWKSLAGNHNWFSSKSVIIITSRNKTILDSAKVDYIYELEEMDKKNSSILFSRHAFRRDTPPKKFEVLTDKVVSATGGLPLCLEVLGSLLYDKNLEVWEDVIKKLGNSPPKEVQEKLRISYDALEDEQKWIFLDIACFFVGTDLRIASYMWDACDFYPKVGIDALRLRSLIKVGEDHELKMHDQLQNLGRQIVREEDMKEVQNRSRLWNPQEVLRMLKENEATKKIEAICFCKDSKKGIRGTTNQGDNILMGKRLKKLKNLRFLEACGAHFNGDFKSSIKKLKWLQWRYCPSTFEACNLYVKELAVLDMTGSNISKKWKGWRFIKMAKKLKYLDLTSCGSLEKTSFLSAFENLEVLILRYCKKIEQIDSSIGSIQSLVRLDLSGCQKLKALPAEVGELEALEQLLLTESGMTKLPDNIGNLQNLETLDIGRTKIEELPNGIGRLRKLRELNASSCHRLGGEMLESIRNLSSLQRLDLSNCKKLRSLSVLPSSLTFLGATCQSHVLPTISNLTHLKELCLSKCEFLECIGEHLSTSAAESLNTPFELEILTIIDCKLMKLLGVSQFNRLRKLNVMYCCNIHEIRGLDKLEYLESLEIDHCASIERLDLPKFEGLKILSARYCKKLVKIEGLDRSKFLEKLEIRCCNSIMRLDLPECESLKVFFAIDCKNLVEVQGLDRLVTLEEVHIPMCCSIKRLDLPKSKGLKTLNATNCKNMVEIQGLNCLESLEEIYISGCPLIQRLDLTKSKRLKKLCVGSCKTLFEIQGLHKLEFLEVLDMSRCTSFRRLPDLCCFDTLHTLAINYGDNLHNIQSLGRFPSCTSLWIEDSECLAEFLDLSNFCNLRTLILSHCLELREISGLEMSTSLKHFAILGCTSIEISPDLSSFTNLVRLVVQNCEKLAELRGLEKLEQPVELGISGCESLRLILELFGKRLYVSEEFPARLSDDALENLAYLSLEEEK